MFSPQEISRLDDPAQSKQCDVDLRQLCSQIDPAIHPTHWQVDILARLHAGILPKQIATDLSYHASGSPPNLGSPDTAAG